MPMRTLAVPLLLLLVAAGSTPAQKQKPKKEKEPPPPSYYPLKVGATWEYRVGADKVTLRVAKEEVEDKETVAVLETTSGGPPISERVSVKEGSVYRHTAEGVPLTPPLCFLKLPGKGEKPAVKDGESWTENGTAGGLTYRGTFTVRKEKKPVAVRSVKYENVITASCPDFQIGRARMALTYWFAPDVGMIKQELRLGDREVLVELEKYTPAK